jgi:hypothetical protein
VPGITIWTDGRALTWTLGGKQTTWAAEDTAGAAAHLAHLAVLANPSRPAAARPGKAPPPSHPAP